jgi:hypothetical protein
VQQDNGDPEDDEHSGASEEKKEHLPVDHGTVLSTWYLGKT